MVFAVALAAAALAPPAEASVLESVKKRGFLRCGVMIDAEGFSFMDAGGHHRGFLPDFCRAIAAAVLSDAQAVEFSPIEAHLWFDTVRRGEIDVLMVASTWTLGREAGHGVDFPAVLYYDGQGFLAHRSLGASSLREATNATICVQEDTTSEANLRDIAQSHPGLKVLKVKSGVGRWDAFYSRRCDIITTDRMLLAGTRSSQPNPDDYIMLPDVISREPIAPAVTNEDPNWRSIVRWVIYATILAEEKNITAANLDTMKTSPNPEVQRLLGVAPGVGKPLGLDDGWASRVIAQVGNYGEIFERNVGQKTRIKLERGMNALWTKGGLMYAPPMR